MRPHHYALQVLWTGNRGTGTSDYGAYGRDHEIRVPGKAPIAGSSDPAFRGEAARHNPEDMLLAALSSCHMLSYLHLAAVAGVVVTAYLDDATGSMALDAGRGRFTEVVLHPAVTIAAGDAAKAAALHEEAHHACFIANSVNFPVRCEPRIIIESV
jgi:organic hydroperoxide reductase OsmC/OhrA